MAMVLQKTRLRLTQAINFGHPGGGGAVSITGANGILMTPSPLTGAGNARLTTLTTDWNAGNKNIKSKNSLVFENAAAWGADPANSAAVNTAAIQNALNTGNDVYIPPGTFSVSSLTISTSLQVLFGAGIGVSILQASGAGAVLTLSVNYGPTIRDLTIDGNATANYGIDINGALAGIESRFIRVQVYNCRGAPGHGISTANAVASYSMVFDCCKINFNNIGLYIVGQTADTRISNCLVYGNNTNQMVLGDGAGIFGVFISNTDIEDTGFLTDVIGILVNRVSPLKLSGVYFESNSTAGSRDIKVIGANQSVINIDNMFSNGNAKGDYSIEIVAGNTSTVTVHESNISNHVVASVLNSGAPGAIVHWYDKNGNVGLNTPSPTVTLDVNGVISPRAAVKSRFGGMMVEGSTTILNYGINEGSTNRFGGAYTQADQGGFIRFDTRAGQPLFSMLARNAGVADPSGFLLWSVLSSGEFGLGTATPTRTLDMTGVQRIRGIAAPAVSEANSGTIYFDSASNTLKASLNGGAYVNVIGSGGLTGSGALNQLTYWDGVTDVAADANLVRGGGYALTFNGNINFANPTDNIAINGVAVLSFNQFAGSVALGTSVLTPGGGDTSVGVAAAINSTGGGTTAVGTQALNAVTAGTFNTSVGANSLLLTTGSGNTAIGKSAGAANTTGTNNIFIGNTADSNAGNYTNAVAIGFGAVVGASNCFALGNSTAFIGVRTGTPKTVVDVAGDLALRQLTLTLVNGLNSDINRVTRASWVRLEGPSAPFSIGGFTGGTDGQILNVYNTVAFQMTIVNEDGASTAINRIKTLTGGNVVLRAGTSACSFQFDIVDDRWILLSSN